MFINIMIDWYSKLYVVIKWNDAYSPLLHVKCGVRQGGILSPVLFNCYINDICALRQSDLGCHINDLFLGCILYADDILLISASVCMLQNMLDICVDVSVDICLL
jgi:Reverse transcriptase (RNA-dependent DNA polymerase)